MIESEYNIVKENFRKWIDSYDLSLIKENISKVNIHEGFLKGESILNHLLSSDGLTAIQKYNVFKIFVEDDKKMILYKDIKNKKQFSPWAELCGVVGDIDSLKELVNVHGIDLIKNLNNGASICYSHENLMPKEILNFYSSLLESGRDIKVSDLENQVKFGEVAYLSYLKNCPKILNNFQNLKELLKVLLIEGFDEAFRQTFEKFNIYMKKPSKSHYFGEANNDEVICFDILNGWASYGNMPLSTVTMLPVIKELDRINPEWMDNPRTQNFLRIKTTIREIAEPTTYRNSIIKFLTGYFHIDDESIRKKIYRVHDGEGLSYTDFQDKLKIKNLPNHDIKIELPILLLYGRDGVDAINYMMSVHPIETKSAIDGLRNVLDILGLPMKSCKKEINTLFEKFDLEEKISNNNKVGKSIKI